jgi:hypothetical protein
MNSKLPVVLTLACLLISAPMVLAQGRGNGLNRGLGGQAKGGAAQAARAGSNLARSGGMGLNRAAPGLSRMGSGPKAPAPSAPGEGDRSLGNQQRILDHRQQQAEHLRGVSERNGNERLLETGDRMDSSAVRNFERQTGTTYQPPAAEGAPAPAPPVQTATQPRKPQGFWFRSR